MIYERILFLCEKNNISIAKLERETNIGNGVIARWKTGSPRVDVIQKVANYFGVTVSYLLGESTSKKRNGA